jgi:hypothetical protein
MSDEAWQKAMEKREQLRNELEKLDDWLEMYRQLVGTEPVRSEATATTNEAQPVKSHGRKRRPGTVRPSDLAPMVRRILEEAGRPMTRSELIEALGARDVVLGGTDKAKYLGTLMWRARDAFVNLEGHGYWPKDEPYPEADYRPEGKPIKLDLNFGGGNVIKSGD